jgi:hypothetical protein
VDMVRNTAAHKTVAEFPMPFSHFSAEMRCFDQDTTLSSNTYIFRTCSTSYVTLIVTVGCEDGSDRLGVQIVNVDGVLPSGIP